MSVRPNSRRARVLAFFDANPDEELTHADFRAKFQMPEWAAKDVVKDMRQRGELESIYVIRRPARAQA